MLLLLLLLCQPVSVSAAFARQRWRLDFDWRFRLGDVAEEQTGQVPGPAARGYDDSGWRVVNTPHDFVVEGEYNQSADLNHGFLFPGVGWYRQRFSLSSQQLANNVRWSVQFDGVYRAAHVWLNGRWLAQHDSGYTGWEVALPPDLLSPDVSNELVLRCDATVFEGYWYEGGGIYRHVWLQGTDSVHIPTHGVIVRSSVPWDAVAANARTAARAVIMLSTTVINNGSTAAHFSLRSAVQEFTSTTVVGSVTSAVLSLEPGAQTTVLQNVSITGGGSGVQLWSPEQPFRYTVHSSLLAAGAGLGSAGAQETDGTWTNFGVRIIEWLPAAGFKLNGQQYKIKGFANHQDFAGVGSALPDSIQFWRLRVLKDLGANAIRCAHSPPAPELLDYADELGLLVWDENRALRNDTNTRADLAAMLARDRNHPSVVVWGLCNEFSCVDWSWDLALELKSMVRNMDGTRPVAVAFSGGDAFYNGLPRALDVIGFNYHPDKWDSFHKKFPTQVVIGSETSAAESTRGVYTDDPSLAHLSSYDVHMPWWANHAYDALRHDWNRKWVAGSFVWTGFDYRGEPYPFGWPAIASSYGVFDLAGFPKDLSFFYRAWLSPAQPAIHVLPHWSLAGVVNTSLPVDVWAYTAAPTAELIVNGVSLGNQTVPWCGFVRWNVTYTPGTLTAIARDSAGKEWAREHVVTVGAAAGVSLSFAPLSATRLWADGQDTAVLTASIVDSEGRTVPTADNLVTFSVSGSGSILGVGNGDSSSHEPDKASQRHAFNGLVRVLVQAARSSSAGPITLTATSSGLHSAAITIPLRTN